MEVPLGRSATAIELADPDPVAIIEATKVVVFCKPAGLLNLDKAESN